MSIIYIYIYVITYIYNVSDKKRKKREKKIYVKPTYAEITDFGKTQNCCTYIIITHRPNTCKSAV